jgi:hypothetical protein
MDYEMALELANTLPGKFAPRCRKCGKVHWLSYKVGQFECAIVSVDKSKLQDFAKQAFEQSQQKDNPLIGQVKVFDNRGIVCQRMRMILLDEYYSLIERETGRGIGGRIIFPGGKA